MNDDDEVELLEDIALTPPRNRAVQYEVKSTPIRARVDIATGRALIAEGRRLNRSTGHVAAQLLRYWLEDTYIPWKAEQEKTKAKSQ